MPVDMYTWTFYGLHKRHLFQIEIPIWFPTVYPQPLSIILGAKSSPVHWQPRLESQPVGSASLVPSDPFHSSSFLGIVFCVSDPTSPCRWPSRSHCLLGFLACCSQHPLLSAPVPLPILGSSLSDSLSALSCGGLHREFREQTLEFASREDAEFWKSFFTFLAFARHADYGYWSLTS